ncbi:unnamed protein product [Caenorhabditis auriculariae]|uniref:Secreted protein n=1 Tax=Caenorhabditis auriculariae TaxID=2777116 RepID=A0A8S1HM56_9PELO|nr:unnamed protein product [Caenorhabditis auriculariae]
MLLLVLAPLFTVAQRTNFPVLFDGRLAHSDTARCYSCMSRLYEAVWPSLSHIYKRPRNFTGKQSRNAIAQKVEL